jgi:putative CocE/NonD family hydrolase
MPRSSHFLLRGGAATIAAALSFCAPASMALAKPPAATSLTADAKPLAMTNVRVQMEDGVELASDIFVPTLDGKSVAPGRYPVLLLRTPYNRKFLSQTFPFPLPPTAGMVSAELAARNGYVVVYQDVRGTGDSDGSFAPMTIEGEDGAATIAWLAKQPWSDGRVATFGPSYMGGLQMLAAAKAPPGLVAVFSQVAATEQFRNEWVYTDGALTQTALDWTATMVGAFDVGLSDVQKASVAADLKTVGIDPASVTKPGIMTETTKHYALRDLPVVRNAPWWRTWIDNRDNPTAFDKNEMAGRYKNIRVPILHLGGWYDLMLRNTLEHYKGVSRSGQNKRVRANQRLVVGPWSHNSCLECQANADIDGTALELAWMDRWMKGKNNPFFDHPVVLYVMGENRWRAERNWPLDGTVRTRFYLQSGGSANSVEGNGTLSTVPPATQAPDHYSYDPRDPVPSNGGPGIMGFRGLQNEAEKRKDVLIFSTPILEEDVEVTGEIAATLYAASSATDTDWWMKLVDVAPDGKAYIVTQGLARARYRTSRTEPKALVPGAIEKYAINMWATSNMFKKGHRIRVEVSSSNYPYAERNPNAFIDLSNVTDKDWVVAAQTVYHDADRPSNVDLPVIPAARARNWIETPFPRPAPTAK